MSQMLRMTTRLSLTLRWVSILGLGNMLYSSFCA